MTESLEDLERQLASNEQIKRKLMKNYKLLDRRQSKMAFEELIKSVCRTCDNLEFRIELIKNRATGRPPW